MIPNQIKKLLIFQQNEITESLVYQKLASIEKNKENKTILQKIANEELKHYNALKLFTNKDSKPFTAKIIFFYFIARIFGVTFSIKLMENGENKAQKSYSQFNNIPEIKQIISEENSHEQSLINMINEEKLNYMGSIVLGLNDALVELTGALAGFTLALQNPKLVALTGIITGVAASLSMASSEYLSSRIETNSKEALKSSIYTGIAYLITVILLIIPFISIHNVLISLTVTLLIAIGIIAAFNYYYSVVKNENFKHRFLEMAIISIGVAAISFIIGYILKIFSGIDA